MKRLFSSLAIIVGIWLLGSFCGVMFDAAHKNLWTQSLMWALLSSVILAPVFLFVGTADSSKTSTPEEEPFEVEGSMEISDQNGEEKREGWPYTESEESGSGSSGAVTPNN